LGTLTIDEKAIALKVTKKDNPEFGQWLEEHAEATLLQLFVQWRNERGSGS
jgi:ParB family chromosome partitioning protein